MLCVALPLAAADLLVKASEPTAAWAFHERSYGWLVLSLALVAGMVCVARIPSAARRARRRRPRRRPPRQLLLGGLERHGRCRTRWSSGRPRIVAFNLADVWALAGIFLLVRAIGTWLIRNRELHPRPGARCGQRAAGHSAASSTDVPELAGQTLDCRVENVEYHGGCP